MKRILALALAVPLAGCFELSDGQFAGQITYFTKRGFFCKTWEGQVIMGGMRKETHTASDGSSVTSSVANTSRFTVEDPSLVSKIQAAFESGRPVRLNYKKEFVTFCRSDGDNNFVTGVIAQ